MSFADNLERLDGILKRLESEPMPLDEALKVFEEGVSLVRESESCLREAEQKVTMLSEPDMDNESDNDVGECYEDDDDGCAGEDDPA